MPKFLADEMLGKLAKWLRILGYDTAYAQGMPDSRLIETALAEHRIILTRDTGLILRKRCSEYIFIRDDYWRNQLAQVYRAAGLDVEGLLTRCPVCNERLQKVEKKSIVALVPDYVFRTQKDFAACRGCSRIFWEATHAAGIFSELERLGVLT